MKCLFKMADDYISRSDWRDLALIKFCLCAVGVLLGLSVPKKNKKFVGVLALLAFVGTYVPLMIKFFSGCKHCEEQVIEID